MLCEECKTNEAVYTVSVIADHAIKTRHLCETCMSRMNASFSGDNIKNLLSSILSAITGTEVAEEPVADVVCPRCQTTLAQFTKSGKLGCPACYEAFHEQLQPMLLQIHGRVQHAGRHPLTSEEAQRSRTRLETLTRQMERAVAVEDYATAARLRDEIRALVRQEEA